jgi:hypothetical protein
VLADSTLPPASPHHAVIEHITAPPRAPRFRASWAASSVGLGRQAVAQPAAHGKPPGRASQATGRFEAHRCAAIFIIF